MLRRSVILLLLLPLIKFDEVTPRAMINRILPDNLGIIQSLNFSLLPSRSDIQRNMIVIGIRFTRRTSMICMEIKEGKLLPGGEIDRNSGEWTTCNVSWSSAPSTYGLEKSNRPNIDYVKIDGDFNYVDLDDFVEQNNRGVTGVAFELSDQCPGVQQLKLRLEYTGFNFTSGQLHPNRTSLSPSICDTNFVRFNVSNLKGNAHQMMQLLLNDQFLESDRPAPSTGIQLFYETFQRVDGGLTLRIHFLNNYPNLKRSKIFDKSSYDDPYDNSLKGIIRRAKRDSEKSSAPWYIFYILIYIVFKISVICMFCKCDKSGESQAWNCCSNEREILVNAIPMPAPDHMI